MRGVSSILLSAPGYDSDFALWAGPVFAMLESGVGAVQAEEMVGVVCFHPECELFPLVGGRAARGLAARRPSPFSRPKPPVRGLTS